MAAKPSEILEFTTKSTSMRVFINLVCGIGLGSTHQQILRGVVHTFIQFAFLLVCVRNSNQILVGQTCKEGVGILSIENGSDDAEHNVRMKFVIFGERIQHKKHVLNLGLME